MSGDGETAMGAKAENGRTGVVKLLLAYGANANDKKKGEVPLIRATKGYHLETVKVLCTKGKAQVNVADFTSDSSQPPLWHAVYPSGGRIHWDDKVRASDNSVKYLLESGADSNL